MKTGISYFGVRNPDFVKIDLQIIRSLGYTHILHTWSEEDLQYYPKTMAEIVEASVKTGLKVYVNPWGVGRVFGGEAYTEFSSRHPGSAQKNNLDQYVVAACPNNPEFRKFMLKWLDVVCATQVETIFWDEPHFYFEKQKENIWCCSCDICQKLFRRKFKHTMPGSLTDSVKAFRQKSILEFLSVMTTYVAKKNKRNSVCLLPPWFNDGVENWEEIAALPHVHEIGTDPYWTKGEKIVTISKTYHEYSGLLKKIADKFNIEAQIWVKNYDIARGNEEAVEAATWAAYNEGIRNIFAWSYKGSAYMDKLASDDPEKVWEIQTNALLECREKLSD
jgi:hypothetical protein